MANVPLTADWRDLARQVQTEKDPRKMVELAEQLVVKLDEEMHKTAPASEKNNSVRFFELGREPS